MILHLIPQLFDDRSSFGYYKNPNFQISKRWHVGHSHHDQTSEESDKIFWLGLSTGKVLTGYLSGSTADAAHALSDVVVIKMFDTSLEEPPQKRLEVEDNRRRKVFRSEILCIMGCLMCFVRLLGAAVTTGLIGYHNNNNSVVQQYGIGIHNTNRLKLSPIDYIYDYAKGRMRIRQKVC
ncbi:hypothetical protein HanXRQr2_Chr05g0229991 [Helianthus annuus]|uniref:Uncharacterized protein n=1 Tax=Helianthus annuus TaxID=4232 RepID=A0A9K3J1Z0_HELAN|nr:hypothetical protein HanXRQr2_Chr05g0229991 [Helianthus annuus]KAJ0923883.1 hypothetical protein HanPSC8_Chr05g0221841 [Helianthus annuus]